MANLVEMMSQLGASLVGSRVLFLEEEDSDWDFVVSTHARVETIKTILLHHGFSVVKEEKEKVDGLNGHRPGCEYRPGRQGRYAGMGYRPCTCGLGNSILPVLKRVVLKKDDLVVDLFVGDASMSLDEQLRRHLEK